MFKTIIPNIIQSYISNPFWSQHVCHGLTTSYVCIVESSILSAEPQLLSKADSEL